jgi:hypothetical protein
MPWRRPTIGRDRFVRRVFLPRAPGGFSPHSLRPARRTLGRHEERARRAAVGEEQARADERHTIRWHAPGEAMIEAGGVVFARLALREDAPEPVAVEILVPPRGDAEKDRLFRSLLRALDQHRGPRPRAMRPPAPPQSRQRARAAARARIRGAGMPDPGHRVPSHQDQDPPQAGQPA